GAMIAVTGVLTGHEPLAGKLFQAGAFDVRQSRRILDAGCGNGRHLRFLLRQMAPEARIAAFDISFGMLKRARPLCTEQVFPVMADLVRLPFADQSFDTAVCGWVLEHFPDPRPALCELARVLSPRGKLLLMVTEDTVMGAVCSRLWHCRTYNRGELQTI